MERLKSGRLHAWHARYGPVVRIGPNEVSVLSPAAIKAVYSDPEFYKYDPFYQQFKHYNSNNVFTSAHRQEHSWRRKGLSVVYSLSHVLSAEQSSGRIATAVREYLALVNQHPQKCIDLYTTNSYYAFDAITAHVFGRLHSSRMLVGNEYHRELVHLYYGRAKQYYVHLRTDLPSLIELTERAKVLLTKARNVFKGKRTTEPECYCGSDIMQWTRETGEKVMNEKEIEVGTVMSKLIPLGWKKEEMLSEVMVS